MCMCVLVVFDCVMLYRDFLRSLRVPFFACCCACFRTCVWTVCLWLIVRCRMVLVVRVIACLRVFVRDLL